jgi:opacity protein-like surface antigen
MKKVLLIALVAILGLGNLNAQDSNIALTAGFHDFTLKASGGGITASDSVQGFYIGVSTTFSVSEELLIQPEFQFVRTSEDGESIEQIILPIVAKYYVSEKFNLQAGPQLDFVVSESDGLNTFGLGLAIGAGFDFSDKVFATSRYAFGLTNRIEDAPSGVSAKFDTFQIGLGFRF